jgi:hypothetical protein
MFTAGPASPRVAEESASFEPVLGHAVMNRVELIARSRATGLIHASFIGRAAYYTAHGATCGDREAPH